MNHCEWIFSVSLLYIQNIHFILIYFVCLLLKFLLWQQVREIDFSPENRGNLFLSYITDLKPTLWIVQIFFEKYAYVLIAHNKIIVFYCSKFQNGTEVKNYHTADNMYYHEAGEIVQRWRFLLFTWLTPVQSTASQCLPCSAKRDLWAGARSKLWTLSGIAPRFPI